MTPTDPSHRRDFVRGLALATIAAPAVADDKKAEPAARPPDEVDARMAVVLARFGKHARLDDKARAAIRSEVADIVRRGQALREIPLDNGDGPSPVFRPYRAPIAR